MDNCEDSCSLDRELSQEEVKTVVLEHRITARKVAKSLLRKWRAYMDAEELDSLADLALCEAANRYQPRHGTKFTTWLFYYIKGRLVRYLVSKGCGKNRVALANRTVDLAQVSEIEIYEQQKRDELSYSVLVDSCYYGLRPDEKLYRKQIVRLSRAAIENLPPVEKKVLQQIYKEGRSVGRVAQELGYSAGHLSRLHNSAIGRLKNYVAKQRRMALV